MVMVFEAMEEGFLILLCKIFYILYVNLNKKYSEWKFIINVMLQVCNPWNPGDIE